MDKKEFKPAVSHGISSLTEQAIGKTSIFALASIMSFVGNELGLRPNRAMETKEIRKKIVRYAKEN